ncbi:MAG: MerR family transcriptional regulator [Actinomycetota bacterium]|nr:MerR family transcriptional regulator [Actinomycetota bacterium]
MRVIVEEKSWKIGELAGATGLTVRTLHHYDEMGLLVPMRRSSAGHRLYSEADVRRLYRVLVLRHLGFPLQDIADYLERGGFDLRAALRRQLDELERHLHAQEELRGRLIRIVEAVEAAEEPSVEQLIDNMEAMMDVEKYYTPEQLSQLDERRKQLGDEGIERSQRDWAELIADVQREREAGTDPGDPRMQELAGRWQGLIDAFTGGDPGIFNSLQSMYDDQGPEKASRGMVDPEAMSYMHRAIEIRNSK